MKRVYISILILIAFITTINATVYESGKGVTNWGMLDALPAKATSVYDSNRSSDVIEFKGKGLDSAYIYGYNSNEWNNSIEKTIKWSMKYSEDYAVYVRVMTTNGFRFFKFTPNGTEGKKEVYIQSVLGDNTKDGEWHDFTIDLETLLKKYESDNSILKVNGIIFRGSGRVDDIELVPTILKKEPKALIIKNSKLYSIDADSKIELLSDNISNSQEDKIIRPKIISNIAYFVANSEDNGIELWRSDGTVTGTYVIKDINPSGNASPDNLIVINNILYFSATDINGDRELWRSNGRIDGTYRVANINLVSSSSPNYLVKMGENLYFIADDGVNGKEIWKSNGTSSGTSIIANINPNGSSSPAELTVMNNILYFSADDGTHGNELWRSDGTENGTYMVKNYIYYNREMGAEPDNLKVLNNLLYYRVHNNAPILGCYDGWSLSQSDGTEEGTNIVKCGGEGSYIVYPVNTIRNNVLFIMEDYGMFPLDGDTYFYDAKELWIVYGDEINKLGKYSSVSKSFVNINEILYFGADDLYSGKGSELWRTDGTVAGTYLVKNINQTKCSNSYMNQIYDDCGSSSFENLTNINNTLYFFANDGVNGKELWKSDGTEDGTKRVILD